METEERNGGDCQPSEPEYFMQWRNGKRLRCVRVKDPETSNRFSGGLRKKMDSSDVDRSLFQPRPTRKPESRKSTSPEKEKEEDRCYMTRGSTVVDENVINQVEEKRMVWPKLYITLSSKEKEEDFMAMKGCKLPHRPKKRAKLIQRSLLSVSPGAWLTDMCQERYEVREKKRSKKRPRGLKAMGSVETRVFYFFQGKLE